MKVNPKEWLWVEKYRPQSINDVIVPDSIKTILEGIKQSGKIPNILLCGSAGVGKTTIAYALCDELHADVMTINASLENGIDIIRTKISQFASTTSFEGNKKVVILDEADFITASGQAALRGFIEEFSNNCTFIFTCNYKNRLIEAIHSRCKVIELKITQTEKPTLAAHFFKRVITILNNGNVEFEKKIVAELVNKYFPDFRRVLNELQSYSASGKIDSGILLNFSDDSFKELVSILKTKKFNDMRKWVSSQSDTDSTAIFNLFFNKAVDILEGKSIPNLILLLGEYQYKAAFVANHEINISALLTELMLGDYSWK